jgi:hypothetical protein
MHILLIKLKKKKILDPSACVFEANEHTRKSIRNSGKKLILCLATGS